MTWECAILKTYAACGGEADNEDIYKKVGDYYPLTHTHTRIDPRYGDRPMLTHTVRKFISMLVEKQELAVVYSLRWSSSAHSEGQAAGRRLLTLWKSD